MFTKHERLISVEEGSCLFLLQEVITNNGGKKRTQVTIETT